MTNLAKFTVEATGWDGAPGVNVLMFSAGSLLDLNDIAVQSAYDEIHTAFDALKGYYAPGINLTVSTEAGIIDAATGDLINIIPVTTAAGTITSTNTHGDQSRASQILVRYTTDRFIRGRRLKGRSFIGPMGGSLMDSDGSLASSVAATVDSAFVAMTSGLGVRLVVWQRPSVANSNTGDYGDVVLAKCQDKVAVLRSRRD